ncbi:MAG TPA: Rieske 2Fe-2S domain-containing protein [Candidatus Binataceae bacterium]|nr:Rieske 2Fe-2S domain-containing protein [Candidatus Binataceae bacterium]
MLEQVNLAELVQDHRVHRKIYVTPEIFELEIERIFERNWVYLGHESEVAEPGDYKTVRIGTQPAILSRDEDGRVHVVMNRCMHRGATICQQERGNSNYLRCWYHGWTYNSRGELIGVPYAGGFGSKFDRSKFALIKPAKVAIYRGLVFTSLSADVEELPDYLGNAKYYLDLFMDLSPEGEIAARAGTHKYGYDGNWKFQMENGVDGYHANFVHQSFFEVQGKRLGRKLMKLFNESTAMESKDLGHGHSILDTAPKRRVEQPVNNLFRGMSSQAATDAYLDSLQRRFGKQRTSEILGASNVNLAIFPNLLIIGVQLRQVIPIAFNRTEVFATPTTLRGVPEEINVARLRAHESFYGPAGGGAPDDVEMFNRCTAGLAVKGAEWLELSRGLEREVITPDGIIAAHLTDEVPQRALYRRWREVICGAAATEPRPAKLALIASGS